VKLTENKEIEDYVLMTLLVMIKTIKLWAWKQPSIKESVTAQWS